MNKKISLLLAIFVTSLFVIPQITLATWWNPGTWKIFNRKAEVKTERTIIATSTLNKIKSEDISNVVKDDTNLGAEAGKLINPSSEKKQEFVLPKITEVSGGGSLLVPVTSGPHPVVPIKTEEKQESTEKQKIRDAQNQLDKIKKNIEQVESSINSWKTASVISTQFYNYRGVQVRIFELLGGGGYRIEFINPGNNQNTQELIQNINKEELNKKVEQVVDNILPKNPAIVAIDKFLQNPTLDNLRSFCDSTKTLPGTEQKKVLNETRTDFVMKTLALYEQSQINDLCNHAFGLRKLKSGKYLSEEEFQAYFQWITYNPAHVLEFNLNDSDSVREIKINFNNYWKSLSAYKLIGFLTHSTSSDITTPNMVMEKEIGKYDAKIMSGRLERMTWDYIIPEKILSEMRRQLINRQF